MEESYKKDRITECYKMIQTDICYHILGYTFRQHQNLPNKSLFSSIQCNMYDTFSYTIASVSTNSMLASCDANIQPSLNLATFF